MATPVVQSQADARGSDAGSLVITKPTGLSEGDLLLVFLQRSYGGGDSERGVYEDKAGWTTVGESGGTFDPVHLKVMRKIADSSDVAASNFTFTLDDEGHQLNSLLLRITGHSSTNPIGGADVSAGNGDVEAYTDDSLLLMGVAGNSFASPQATISGYTISGTNPTWTELYDNNQSEAVLAVASATANESGTITSYSATPSDSFANSRWALLSIPTPTPVTTTPDSISLITETSAPTLKAKVKVTPNAIALTSALSAPTVTGAVKKWFNQAKSAVSWSNQSKS